MKRCAFGLIILLCNFSYSQIEPLITVSGKVLDRQTSSSPSRIMIINQHSGTGLFANFDGSYTIQLHKSDTLLFNSTGFASKRICFKDSLFKPTYINIQVQLERLQYQLNEVNVYAPRMLDDIQKDINQLGVKKTNVYKEVDVASPISYLYERFSKMEQSKRKVAELENEDRKRDVLKDLFRIYIKYDIIKLSDAQFDNFITYCSFSDNFIKQSEPYDLVMAIKKKYAEFSKKNSYYNEIKH